MKKFIKNVGLVLGSFVLGIIVTLFLGKRPSGFDPDHWVYSKEFAWWVVQAIISIQIGIAATILIIRRIRKQGWTVGFGGFKTLLQKYLLKATALVKKLGGVKTLLQKYLPKVARPAKKLGRLALAFVGVGILVGVVWLSPSGLANTLLPFVLKLFAVIGSLLVIPVATIGLWMVTRKERDGMSDQQKRRVSKYRLAGKIVLAVTGVVFILVLYYWIGPLVPKVLLYVLGVLALVGIVWFIISFLRKKRTAETAGGAQEGYATDERGETAKKVAIGLGGSLLFLAMFLVYVSWSFGVDPFTALTDTPFIILPILAVPAGAVLAGLSNSRAMRWVMYITMFLALSMVYGVMANVYTKREIQKVTEKPPTARDWVMWWEKYNRDNLYVNIWGDWESYPASFVEFSDTNIVMIAYVKGVNGMAMKRTFVWDKKKDPKYGAWREEGSSARGKWTMWLVAKSPSQWWFDGEMWLINAKNDDNEKNGTLVQFKVKEKKSRS